MEDEEDMKVIVNHEEEIILEAVKVDVLRQYSQEDNTIISLIKDVQKERLTKKFKETKYKAVFEELALVKGILLRGQRVVPGSRHPSNNGSRHPSPRKDYIRLNRENLGIKKDE